MDKELLMLYGARNAVFRMLEKGSTSFAKKLYEDNWQTVAWIDIANYLSDMIEKYKAEVRDDGKD